MVRTKDISGGFTPDPNWEATQDIAAWLASEPLWHRPDYSKDGAGTIELMVSFYDDASTSIDPPINARVDLQVVEQIIAPGLPARLIITGDDIILSGDSILEPVRKNNFPAQLAYRIAGVQNIPAANFMSLLARLV